MNKVEGSGGKRKEENGETGIEHLVHGEMVQRLGVHRIGTVQSEKGRQDRDHERNGNLIPGVGIVAYSTNECRG